MSALNTHGPTEINVADSNHSELNGGNFAESNISDACDSTTAAESGCGSASPAVQNHEVRDAKKIFFSPFTLLSLQF